jgi:hypothetical protein
METDVRGGFDMGAGIRGRFNMEVGIGGKLNMEVHIGGGFNMEGGLVFMGAGYFRGQVILARKSKTCYPILSLFKKGKSAYSKLGVRAHMFLYSCLIST